MKFSNPASLTFNLNGDTYKGSRLTDAIGNTVWQILRISQTGTNKTFLVSGIDFLKVSGLASNLRIDDLTTISNKSEIDAEFSQTERLEILEEVEKWESQGFDER